MIRRLRGALVPSLLALSVLSPLAPRAMAASLCTGAEPTAILDCLSSAYERRDYAAYQALLANDFRFVTYADTTELGGWDRAKDLESTKALFQDAKVVWVRLTFDSAKLKATPLAGDLWVLSPLAAHLKIQAHEEEGTKVFEVDNPEFRLFIRKAAAPSPHFEIYRWEDHQPAKQ